MLGGDGHNQFAEQFGVTELAEKVQQPAAHPGIEATVMYAPKPFGEELIETMMHKIARYKDRINHHQLVMGITWAPKPAAEPSAALAAEPTAR